MRVVALVRSGAGGDIVRVREFLRVAEAGVDRVHSPDRRHDAVGFGSCWGGDGSQPDRFVDLLERSHAGRRYRRTGEAGE